MPVNPTYPGVYIQELPSGVHTITGVATSITAFIGRAKAGPSNEAVTINSYADYARIFDDLWSQSPMSYAVQQFFLNGGSQAVIVRVQNGGSKATIKLATDQTSTTAPVLEARGEGGWGNFIQVVAKQVTPPAGTTTVTKYNLWIKYQEKPTDPGMLERFFNLSIDPSDPLYAQEVLEADSSLVRLSVNPTALPDNTTDPDPGKDIFQHAYPTATNTTGNDGNAISDNDISAAGLAANKQGLWALEGVDLFNLLCIPPLTFTTDIGQQTISAAAAYCNKRRAFFIVDPPGTWQSPHDASQGVSNLLVDDHAAVYFPRVIMPDPLANGRLSDFAPCGVIAGIYARTDANRGVWKAPAGIEATLLGVASLGLTPTPPPLLINDVDSGTLNQAGVNALRSFPVTGRVVWGARTMRGADQLADQYKYIPVRRTALYIEESLYRGLQWAVFEPNDEPLWAQIRLNVGVFMHDLFVKGAFEGKSPKDAYLVKCDSETTTQSDINQGIVNVIVGFAPLKPAEFVIISIQQLAGQLQVA